MSTFIYLNDIACNSSSLKLVTNKSETLFILDLEIVCLRTITYPLIFTIYAKSCYDFLETKCACGCVWDRLKVAHVRLLVDSVSRKM